MVSTNLHFQNLPATGRGTARKAGGGGVIPKPAPASRHLAQRIPGPGVRSAAMHMAQPFQRIQRCLNPASDLQPLRIAPRDGFGIHRARPQGLDHRRRLADGIAREQRLARRCFGKRSFDLRARTGLLEFDDSRYKPVSIQRQFDFLHYTVSLTQDFDDALVMADVVER